MRRPHATTCSLPSSVGQDPFPAHGPCELQGLSFPGIVFGKNLGRYYSTYGNLVLPLLLLQAFEHAVLTQNLKRKKRKVHDGGKREYFILLQVRREWDLIPETPGIG